MLELNQLYNMDCMEGMKTFPDKYFDLARQKANDIAEYMRRHGPFEPHRLPLEEMEYTTMPEVAKKLDARFTDLD